MGVEMIDAVRLCSLICMILSSIVCVTGNIEGAIYMAILAIYFMEASK